MQKKSFARQAAYGGAFSALAAVFLLVSVIFPFVPYFWFYVAASCVMFPLALGYVFSAFAVYAVSSLIALIYSGFNFAFLLPFLIFMGWHPIMSYILRKYKKLWLLRIILTLVLFDAGLYACYLIAKVFILNYEFFNNYIYIGILACTPLGLLYDYGMGKQQKKVTALLAKLGSGRG